MSTIGVITVLVTAAVLLFVVLQWRSDKAYKPSKSEIREIIQASINGSITLHEFDTFSSVRIAYDKDLENIRNKYNDIVGNTKYINNEATEDDVASLNTAGRERLEILLNDI